MLKPNFKPRVSIGVPVYNGQRFLRATLDSILAQTYTNFELIICDNCSTDGTEAICREYLAKDSRIRYIRHDRNLGPAPNYNRCFEEARGELFKWNAADDLIAPQFLERCIEMLDSDPSMVSVYTRTLLIDEDGNVQRKYDRDLDLDHRWAFCRFARFVFVNHRTHNAHEFWGVTRCSALRKTTMKGSFPSADRILTSWWTLLGKVGRVEEYLFLNREHQQRSQHAVAKKDLRQGSKLSNWVGGGPTPAYEWWDARFRGKIVFPEWRWVWEYLRAVRCAKMPWNQKMMAYGVMIGIYAKFLPRLARDLVIATEQAFYRVFSRDDSVPTTAAPENSR